MNNNVAGSVELKCPTCSKDYKLGQITCDNCARVLETNMKISEKTRIVPASYGINTGPTSTV